jgi:hypothetical protein
MKKSVIKNKKFIFIVFTFLFFLAMPFILADHLITSTPSVLSVDEDVGFVYKINVANTDTGTSANITQVDITLPSSFVFLAGSNNTNASSHTFTNTSNVLTWENDGLVMNETTKYFEFNATAFTPGDYNFTIDTTNSTTTITSNVSVTINDKTPPEVLESSITSPVSNSNHSDTLTLSVNVIDNLGVEAVIFNLTNASISQTYSASSAGGNTWTTPLNTNDFSNGFYNLTVYANDSAGNLNDSAFVYNVFFDNTNPTITFSCSPLSLNKGNTITCSCSGADADSGVLSTSYTKNPSTSSVGTSTTTCTITDYAGNLISSSIEYVVKSFESGGPPTYAPSESQLKEGYKKVMYENWRVSFKVGSSSHTFKVEDLTQTSAKITISSQTQEAVLLIGEEKKFDVSGDGYYDVLVKLNSIDSNVIKKAEFEIKKINEKIEKEAIEEEPETGQELEEPKKVF